MGSRLVSVETTRVAGSILLKSNIPLPEKRKTRFPFSHVWSLGEVNSEKYPILSDFHHFYLHFLSLGLIIHVLFKHKSLK